MKANEENEVRCLRYTIKNISTNKPVSLDENGIERNNTQGGNWVKKEHILKAPTNRKYYQRTNIWREQFLIKGRKFGL